MPEEAPTRLRLTRAMRLQETHEFARVRTEGRRLVKGCLIANWKPLSPGASPRLGVVTSRKLGKATIRTRARRLLREAFRLHQRELREPLALVLVARASIVGKGLAEVERDFLAVLAQANLLKKNE